MCLCERKFAFMLLYVSTRRSNYSARTQKTIPSPSYSIYKRSQTVQHLFSLIYRSHSNHPIQRNLRNNLPPVPRPVLWLPSRRSDRVMIRMHGLENILLSLPLRGPLSHDENSDHGAEDDDQERHGDGKSHDRRAATRDVGGSWV